MTDIKGNNVQVQITVTTKKKHSLKETVLFYTFDQASGFGFSAGFSGWGAAVGASVGF